MMNEQSHQTNHSLKIRDVENSASLQTCLWRRDWLEQGSVPFEIEKWGIIETVESLHLEVGTVAPH